MSMKPKVPVAQDLLDKYNLRDHGFTTADKIKRPPPKPRWVELPDQAAEPPAAAVAQPVAPKTAERWSREKRQAFDLLAPHALYVAATDGPLSITVLEPNGDVKQRFGHNRGCWPVKIGTTSSQRDTITPLIDKDPFVVITVKRRLWLPIPTEANSLALHVAALLKASAEEAGFEQLIHGYTDAGPNFNAESFERHILLLAKKMDVVCWTEDGLSIFCDRLLEAAKLKGIEIVGPRGRGINHPGFIKLADKMVEQERQKQFVGRRNG